MGHSEQPHSAFLEAARNFLDNDSVDYIFPKSKVPIKHRQITVEDMIVNGMLPDGITPKDIAAMQNQASDSDSVEAASSVFENMSVMRKIGQTMILSSMIGSEMELNMMRDELMPRLPTSDIMAFMNHASGVDNPEQESFPETPPEAEAEPSDIVGQPGEEIRDATP